MSLDVHADPPPLDVADDGVVRISGTRIPLERVIRAFLAGSTPEQIAHDYDVLSIADVYAVVKYYLHHQSDVDAYLAEAAEAAAGMRDEIERQFDPAGIRERLIARHSAKAE